MANICFNSIEIFGESKAIKKIKSKYKDEILEDDIYSDGETELKFRYESRWAPPIDWIQELSNFGVIVECIYDECGANMCGKFAYKNGDKVFEIDFTYLEGMYNFVEWCNFLEDEVMWRLDNYEDVEEFIEDFPFVTDDEREELISIFNEANEYEKANF
jgi:hypothetical protein